MEGKSMTPCREILLFVVPPRNSLVSVSDLKGLFSFYGALQGSEMKRREFLGGTEENSVSRQGVIDLPSRQINDTLLL